MSFANKLSEMRNCSATLQHKGKRDKGHQVWQTLLTIHAEMPPLEPRGTLETLLPQQKYCTKGKLPTAGAGPVGPVSVQLGPGAEPDEPRGALDLQVAFHLHSVMGETPSPSHVCLQHLITLEISGTRTMLGQGQTQVFTHFLREEFAQL